MNICEIYLHNMLILPEKKGAASFRKQPQPVDKSMQTPRIHDIIRIMIPG